MWDLWSEFYKYKHIGLLHIFLVVGIINLTCLQHHVPTGDCEQRAVTSHHPKRTLIDVL